MAQPITFLQLTTTPIYNTRAVARETGVPPDTFRAWERRYGVPRPERTAGGHRLYSERDIAIIRWLRDRTAEGMNISHAVMLLTSALEERVAPVAEETRGVAHLVDELVERLIVFDGPRAELLVSEAFALYPFERVLLDIIQPTMVEVGERWHRGEINVAAEHFATEFVRRKLAGLLNVFENSAQRETIVVACAPGELHDIGLLFSSLFLVRRGWHVVYLGPQVPLPDLLATVQSVRPALVCVSATTIETALEALEVARAVTSSFPQVHFGYGGRVFNLNPEVRQQMPGVFLGADGRSLISTVSALFARPPVASHESPN